MGNRPLLFVFFALIVSFSSFSWADNWKQECQSQAYAKANPSLCGQIQSSRTPQQGRSSQPSGAGNRCSSDPSAYETITGMLDYVGVKFNSEGAQCVTAFNDGEAVRACSALMKTGNIKILNPGNPQYGHPLSSAVNGKSGSRSSNEFGFYLCFRGNTNDKRSICEQLRSSPNASSYNSGKSSSDKTFVNFVWQAAGGDGDCLCYYPNNGGSASKGLKCDQAPPAIAVVECSAPHMEITADGKSCECEKPYLWDEKKGCTTVANTPEVTSPPAATPGVTQAMLNCVDEHVKLADQCVADAEEAKKTCDPKNKQNPEVAEAEENVEAGKYTAEFVSGLSNAYVGANTGKMANDSFLNGCFNAAVVSNGTNKLMTSLDENKCKPNFEKCTQSCSDQVMQSYRKKCGDIYRSQVLQAPGEDGNTEAVVVNEDQNHFVKNVPVIEGKVATGEKVCKVEAAKNKSILSGLLDGLGKSLAAGMRCVCQVTSKVAGGNCTNLPTPAECAANPSLPGCANSAGVIDVCTMGSSAYNPTLCKCQFDPRAAGCGTTLGNNNSGFAGATTRGESSTGAGGGAQFGTQTSSGGGGDIDLSGLKGGSPGAAPKKGELGAGFTGSGYGSPGGAGGSASSSGGGNSGAPAGQEDGDGGGKPSMWNQAKSTFSGLFTGKQNQGLQPGKGQPGLKFDKDKFKPNMRGVANDAEFGGKNKDIWKTVNNRYNENHMTFINAP